MDSQQPPRPATDVSNHTDCTPEESSLNRRNFLKLTAAAGATAAVAGCTDTDDGQGTGGPGGGGQFGGDRAVQSDLTQADANTTVNSPEQIANLADQGSGNVIWVQNIEGGYDMTGQDFELTNQLASDGALLYTTDRGAQSPAYKGGNGNGMITATHDDARISGLRLQGPAHNAYDNPNYPGFIPYPDFSQYSHSERMDFYDTWHARAITLLGNATVDNCEIFGWPTQGIVVGSQSDAPEVLIVSCYFHDNMLSSAGYGVDVKRGFARIGECDFDAHRHAVNGYGHEDCGYYVLQCRFGPHNSSHVIDMHRIEQNSRGATSDDPNSPRYGQRAGSRMVVERSKFWGTETIPDSRGGADTNEWVHIRGVPTDGVYLVDNVVEWDGPNDNGIPIRQTGIDGHSTDDRGFVRIYEQGTQYNTTPQMDSQGGQGGQGQTGPATPGDSQAGRGRGQGQPGPTAADTPAAGGNRPQTTASGPVGIDGGDVTGNWSITFEDQFDRGELNTNNWSIGYGWGRTSGDRWEEVRDEDVWVDPQSETLTLQLAHEGTNWYSGAVNTKDKHSQQYGLWEASIRMPDQIDGLLPAFWSKPNNEDWPPEIDFVERFGRPQGTSHTIHYNDGSGKDKDAVGNEYEQPVHANYHVFGCEWTENEVTWYVDGQSVGSTSQGLGSSNRMLNYGQPYYTMLSCHITDMDGLGDPRDSNYPATWNVDWVRVWERA